MKKFLLAFLCLLAVGISASADPVTLFHETFGNNSGSARAWNDSYKVQSGIEAVYSGASYTIENAKQSKNTVGSPGSALTQTTKEQDAYFLVGPLDLSNCSNVTLSYKWKATSIKGTFSSSIYYGTGAPDNATNEILHSVTPTVASTFYEVSVSVPAAALKSNAYFKVVFNSSNDSAVIDEFDLSGTYTGATISVTGISLNEASKALNPEGSFLLEATVSPSNATNKAVAWTSSNPEAVTVSDTGLIAALATAEGRSAVITATTVDGGRTATCNVTVNTMAPGTKRATLDFSNANTDWGIPKTSTTEEGTYTNSPYTIKINASDGHKDNNGCVLMGKEGATLTLPAFDFDVTKIIVYGNSGGAAGTTQNIFVGENPVSTQTTSAKVDHLYVINVDSRAAGTVYTLKVTNSNNTQIKKIEVYGVEHNYTITYYPNGGTGVMAIDNFDGGTDATLKPANTFTREGYTFSKWNTAADGSGTAYEAGATITGINKDYELYAQWTENAVTPPVTPGTPGTYTLVTSQDQIAAGYEYVICAETSDYIMATQSSNNFQGAAFEVTDGVISTLPDGAQIVKFLNSQNSGNFDMQLSDGKYLAATGNNTGSSNQNHLKTLDATGETTETSIVFKEGHVEITFVNVNQDGTGKAGRYLNYNKNNGGNTPLFSAYITDVSNSSYEHLRLFRKVVSATEPKAVVFSKTGQLIGDGANQNNTVTLTSQNATEIKWKKDGVEQTALTANAGVASLTITEDCTIEAWGYNASTEEAGPHSEASFTVQYVPTAAQKPAFTMAGGSNVAYNTPVTISLPAGTPAYCTLEVSTDGTNYTEQTSPYEFTLTADVTLYARTVSVAGTSDVVSYSFTVKAPVVKNFRLVSSLDQLDVDNEYIIVNGRTAGTHKALNGTQNDNPKDLDGVEVTVNITSDQGVEVDNIVTINEASVENCGIFTLKEGYKDESYALQYPDGRYLVFSTEGDTQCFTVSNTLDNSSSVSITLEAEGKWSKIMGDNGRWIRFYNNTSDATKSRFRAYTTNQSGTDPVYLYQLVDITKAIRPSLSVVSGTADDGGYYNNEITLKATCPQTGATIKYSTDYDSSNPSAATWQTIPATWTLNAPATIVLKAEKSGLEDSDVTSPYVFKFRPAAPTFAVAQGLSVSKKATITPSVTEGAVTEWQTPAGTWEAITEPKVVIVTETETIYARAIKSGYNPNTVTTGHNVTITYDGTEEDTHTYDTCPEGAQTLTSTWHGNRTYRDFQGVSWYVDVDNGKDGVYFHTNFGQIGSLESNNLVTNVNVSTDEIPGLITKIILNVSSGHADGGTYVVKVGGNTYGTGSYTGSSADIVIEGAAKGKIELEFTNNTESSFKFSCVRIDYTPVADLDKVRTPRFSLESGTYAIDTEVTLTCSTKKARIYYTTDGTTPTEGSTLYTEPIVLENDVTITARAFKDGLEPSNVASAIYTVIEGEVYELITAGTKLEEGDEIIIVNNLPMSSEYVVDKTGNPYEWNEANWYAMGYEKAIFNGKERAYYEALPLVEVKNSDADRPRQLMATHNQKIARFRLAKQPIDANYDANYPWLLQCGTKQIEDPAHPGQMIEVPTYVESLVSGKDHTMKFEPLPEDASQRSRMKTRFDVKGTAESPETDFAKYHKNGTDYNCSASDNGPVTDKGIIAFAGINNGNLEYATIRFNPQNMLHFNCYGYTPGESGNDLHTSTWPVSFYRSTNRLYRPSITVYSQTVNMENYNKPIEWDDLPLGEDVYPMYNAVKIVVKENPRTDRNSILCYHWAKTENDIPVPEEYTKITGTSGVKGADMTVYLDGYKLWYTDVDNNDYVIDQKPFSNSQEWMESALFSISTLDDVASPNTHRKFKFKTTAPDIKKAEKDGKKGVYINRPEVFTKGAVLYYTKDGITEPSVTWTYNESTKTWEATPAAGVKGPWTPGEFMEIADGQTVKVGAFKYGYEPSFATISNLTVMPTARPIQLLELSADGLTQIYNASSAATKGEIDALDSSKKTYLTFRAESPEEMLNPKYYVLQYTTDSQNKLTNINIVDVPNDAAKAVINNPHKFKWTSDYYVFGMRLDDFLGQIGYTEDGEGNPTGTLYQNAEMYIHDGAHRARVIPTEFDLNEDDELGSPDKVKYYGSVVRRNGALGTNYFTTEFTYEAKAQGEAKFTTYNTSRVTAVTPAIPAPFDLDYKYVTVRDNSNEYNPEEDFEFTTGSSVNKYKEWLSNHENKSDEEVANVNTLKFRKEDFSLRHLNCVFTFHRPNISDAILDNYDIVYDVEVLTGEGFANLRHKYVDPLKSADIAKITGDHDAINRYDFTVNNVHPNHEVFPRLVIHGVNYYPNGENEGYSELPANYFGDGSADMNKFYNLVSQYEVTDENNVTTTVNKKVQLCQAPNATSASKPDVNMSIHFTRDGEKFDWYIDNHTLVSNDQVYAHEGVKVEAPFMYQIEGMYGDDVNTYYSHEYLIQHSASDCGVNHQPGSEEDPFHGVYVGKGYTDFYKQPTIYVTPIYFFERLPEPNVTEEGALVEYDIHYADNQKNAPNRAPMRAGEMDGDNPEAPQAEPQIVIVRGKEAAAVEPHWIYTGVPGVAVGNDQILQDGNDLLLPEGARLFDLNGLQIEPKALMPGVYIVKFANGASTKVAVK